MYALRTRALCIASDKHIHSFHDGVLLGVVRLVLRGDLQDGGNHFHIAVEQVSNVIGDLRKKEWAID